MLDNDELLKKFNCTDFYIDKSLLIKEFLDESSKIVCVTRPSGYGKTVNLNMLRYFFEMNFKDENDNENRELFEKLNIDDEFNKYSERYIDLYQGKFPVIYIDFNEIEIGSSYEEPIEKFKYFIQTLYRKYQNIKIENLPKYEKSMREKFINCNANLIELNYSISFLCTCLYYSFKGEKQIVLLIDNYDSLILKFFNKNFFNDICSFYKNVLIDIFNKDKMLNYTFKTFITGKIYIPLFYNFKINNYTVFDTEYNEYYSITESELKVLMDRLNLENSIKIFEKYCISNITNVNNAKEINILISS